MKIAVAGYGIEGEANYRYFSQRGDVTIVDEHATPARPIPSGAAVIRGSGAFNQLDGFDLVVRTAGLAPSKIKTDGKMWSATNEFFAKCSAPIIGVTGTKGKGTTCSLITEILRAAGRTVHLVGNIGTPALDVLPAINPQDVVVYELSSFQLWDLERSPHIAVVLMIEPDHLDVHADLNDYVRAKGNIRRHQGSSATCLYHPTNAYAKQIATSVNEGVAARYALHDDGQVYIHEGYFRVEGQKICSTEHLRLPGLHNLENACAAMSAVRVLVGDDITNEQYASGLQNFAGLPHRLKFVDEINNVKYYDDSIATTPGSAIAALRSFSQPKILILGGSDKGATYGEVIDAVTETNARIIAIGQTGREIAKLAADKGLDVTYENGMMPEVVARAAEIAPSGSVVILSPASASFDQYANYAERGDRFIEAVKELKNGK